MTKPSPSLLAVEALEQSFGGVMALAGVSFQTPENLIYAIIGPNGAGKTTLFNVLCGFYQPAAGSLRFNGHELRDLPPHRIAAHRPHFSKPATVLQHDRPGKRHGPVIIPLTIMFCYL